jgi:hypothetical protein
MMDSEDIFSAFGFDNFVDGSFRIQFDTTTGSAVQIPVSFPTDSDELDGRKYLDDLLQQARDISFDFSNPEDVEEDPISRFIRQRDLDEEIDFFAESTTEDLVREIINGLDDINLSSSESSLCDSDESDSETEKGVFLSGEDSFSRPRSKAQTVYSRTVKRNNQDLKRDALFQPLEHLYSQK